MASKSSVHQLQKVELEKLVKVYRDRNDRGAGGKVRYAEKVFDYVVENIRTGVFPPSTRITERDLARQLDISHVPVREAMERLQQHGWTEKIPQKGTYVRNFNQNEIAEIYLIREIIEAGAARQIAVTINSDQLKELKKVTDLLESAYESDNAEVFKDADAQFHRLLVHFTGSPRLDNIFESVVLQAKCFFFIGASGASLYAQKAREYHQPVSHTLIYEAIEAHDVDLAENLVRQHIQAGRSMIAELRDFLNLK